MKFDCVAWPIFTAPSSANFAASFSAILSANFFFFLW
jgi:hypothetical protein